MQYLDEAEGQVSCQASCPGDLIELAGVGTCVGGGYCSSIGGMNYGGQCLEQCPAGTEQIGQSCQIVCPDGQVSQGNQCVSTCPQGSTWQDGACRVASCPDGQERVGDVCLDSCAAGEVREGSQCVAVQCSVDELVVDGICTPASEAPYENLVEACVENINSGGGFPVQDELQGATSEETCENLIDAICEAGIEDDTAGAQYAACGERPCDEGQQNIGGQCMCPEGQFEREDGACGQICPAGQVSMADGSCGAQCATGTFLNDAGQCVVECPGGVALNGQCFANRACPAGYVPKPSGECVATSCTPDQVTNADGTCSSPCPEGQQPSFQNPAICRAVAECGEGGIPADGYEGCRNECGREGYNGADSYVVYEGFCTRRTEVPYEDVLENCLDGRGYGSQLESVSQDACEAAIVEHCTELDNGRNTMARYCGDIYQPAEDEFVAPPTEEPLCATGQAVYGGTCVDDTMIEEICSGGVLIGGQCSASCPAGTEQVGNRCEGTPQVPEDEQAPVEDPVECPPGQAGYEGACIDDAMVEEICGGGVLSNGQCETACPAGMVQQGNRCETPPPEEPPVVVQDPPGDGQDAPPKEEQPPADESQPPADENQAPDDESQPPTDESQSPDEENQPPADENQTPDDESQPPADENQAPDEESQPPADENQAPDEENQPPADENQSPDEESQPPADENQSPDEESQPPADENQAPDEENQPPADENQSPDEENQPPADENQAPDDGSQPPADENQAPDDESQPPADENQSPDEENQPPADENQAPDDESQPPADENQAPDEENQPPADENQSPDEESQPPADENQSPDEDQPSPPPSGGTPKPQPPTEQRPTEPEPDQSPSKQRNPAPAKPEISAAPERKSTDKPDAEATPFAIVISNDRYRAKGIPQKPHAHEGAESFVRFLADEMGLDRSRIIRFSNPGKADMDALFGTSDSPDGHLKIALDHLPSSELIFYYSGHALPVDGGSDALLLPSDVTPAKAAETSFRLSTLYRNLQKLRIRHLRIYFDAGFNQNIAAEPLAIAPPVSPVSVGPPKTIFGTANPRWVMFSAGTGDQPVLFQQGERVSIFNRYLLEGLRGAADRAGNSDRTVTAGELSAYLQKQVPQAVEALTGGVQTPSFTGGLGEILVAKRTEPAPAADQSAAPTATPEVSPEKPADVSPPLPTAKPQRSPSISTEPTPSEPEAETEEPKAETPAKPSFDCRKARSRDEKAICANPEIARLDSQMAKLYSKRRRSLRGAAGRKLTQSQRAWLGKRRACGSNVSCLKSVFQERIRQLR